MIKTKYVIICYSLIRLYECEYGRGNFNYKLARIFKNELVMLELNTE